MARAWQDEMDDWFEEPVGRWAGDGPDGGTDLGELRTIVVYGSEVIDSWPRPVAGSGYEQAVEAVDRRWRPAPPPRVVEVDRTPRHEAELAWLARLVGSRASLDALDVEPLPDEPVELACVRTAHRERVASIATHLDRATGLLGDPELAVACRRALVRGIRANPGLLALTDDDARVAGAVLLAVGKGNALIGATATPATVVQTLLGLRSLPHERATRWAHAIGGLPGIGWERGWPLVRPDVPILGSPDLLTSRFRSHLLRLRDLALAEAERARPAA